MEGEKEKAKKDKYQKALTSYEQAMKVFHKGDCAKASELLKVFIEKHDSEKELVEDLALVVAPAAEEIRHSARQLLDAKRPVGIRLRLRQGDAIHPDANPDARERFPLGVADGAADAGRALEGREQVALGHLDEVEILYSTREFKKERVRYFAERPQPHTPEEGT